MMRTPFAVFLVLVLSGGLAVTLGAQDAPEAPFLEERIDAVMEDWDRLDRPGGAVAVVQDGNVIHIKGYGLASLEHDVPNTSKTVFDASALAHPVTAMAVAMLEVQGKISLDQQVGAFLPDLPEWQKELRVRDLLFHTSGLWDWPLMLRLTGQRLENVIGSGQIEAVIQLQEQPTHPPGAELSFSMTDYVLLAETVAQITGSSFRDWCWENVLKPLGMTRSLFRDLEREVVPRRASSYNFDPTNGYLNGADNLSAVGACGLLATIEDAARWLVNLHTLTVGGEGVVPRLLEPGTLATGDEVDYTYGFHVDSHNGARRLWHDGSWGGSRSAVLYFPDHALGVVVLSNWDYSYHEPVSTAQRLADLFLTDSEETSEGASSAPEERPEVEVDPSVFEVYVGEYRLRPDWRAKIVRDGDQLFLEVAQGNRYRLHAASPTEYFLKVVDFEMDFATDAQGNVVSVTYRYRGEELVGPRVERMHPTPDQLDAYAGDYVLEGFDATYGVVRRDDALLLVTPDDRELALIPEARDHFVTASSLYPLLAFARDVSQITGFTIETESTRGLVFSRRSAGSGGP